MSANRQLEQFGRYLKYERGYSAHTLEAYRRDIRQFLDFYAEYANRVPLDLKAINKLGIRHYLGMLAESGLEMSSIGRKLASLKAFFKFLTRQGILTKNPAAMVKSPKTKKRLPVVLSEAELATLFRNFDEEHFVEVRNKAILELFYSTGMRLSELLNLNFGDLNRDRQLVRVFGKGSKERVVPLGKRAMKILKVYLAKRCQEFGRIQLDSPLFISKRGTRIARATVQKMVTAQLQKVSEQEHLSAHVLRHSFASHMLDHGADLNAVKDLLGHNSLSTTQLYTHIRIGKMKKIYQQAHPHGE